MSYATFANKRYNLNGIYIGTVVENRDPEKMGRIKCFIAGLLDEESLVDKDTELNGLFKKRAEAIEALPWVSRIAPSFTGSTGTSGTVSIPKMGSKVVIQFPTNDPYFPVYFGVIQDTVEYVGRYNEVRAKNQEEAGETPSSAPDVLGKSTTVHGLVTSSGAMVYIDDATGELTVWHPSSTDSCDTIIKVSQDGSITISSATSVNINSGRDISMKAMGTLNLQGNKVNLIGASVVNVDSPMFKGQNPYQASNGANGMVVGINGSVAVFNSGVLSGSM